MKTFRINPLIVGILYFLGTVFGIASTLVGGEVVSSIVNNNSLSDLDFLALAAVNSSQITGASFLILLMGISLTAMTVFLYPIFRKDSEELAAGMLLFRGALEGTYYFISTMGFITLLLVDNEYMMVGADSTS